MAFVLSPSRRSRCQGIVENVESEHSLIKAQFSTLSSSLQGMKDRVSTEVNDYCRMIDDKHELELLRARRALEMERERERRRISCCKHVQAFYRMYRAKMKLKELRESKAVTMISCCYRVSRSCRRVRRIRLRRKYHDEVATDIQRFLR